MEYKSIVLKGKASEKIEFIPGCDFAIINIALTDCEDGKSNVISVKSGSEEFVIGTLIAGKIPQMSCELTFPAPEDEDSEEEAVSICANGAGTIHVLGAFIPSEDEEDMYPEDFDEMDDEDDEDDDEDEDEDDEEEEEEVEEVPEPPKKEAKIEAPKKVETPKKEAAPKKAETPKKEATPKKAETPKKTETPKKNTPKKTPKKN